MIHLYDERIGGMWFAVAIENEDVLGTCYSTNQEEVLLRLAKRLPSNMPFQKEAKQTKFAAKLLRILGAIFDGKDALPSFKLALSHVSGYPVGVLRCVSAVPIGYVTTYGAVAKVAGGSPRSIGQVMASNPVPLLIPCHRVVRADFSLGGYGLGEEMKLLLLQRENRGYTEAGTINVNRKALQVFPVKFLQPFQRLEINTSAHNQ